MSRSIEAAIGDPAAVSMPMLRLTAVSPGLKPFSAAIAQHSANILLANWLAPAAAISPKAPRIRQQMPAAAAMNAHFSHISCRIAVDNWESNFAIECRRDDALPAEHRAGAESRGEQIHMLHAVEKRQDRGVGPEGQRKGIHRALQIVGLAAQKNKIEWRA